MILIEDTRQKADKHSIKHEYFKKRNLITLSTTLPVGDYCICNENIASIMINHKFGENVKGEELLGLYDKCVDTKQNINELFYNFTEHNRLIKEMLKAQEMGIKLYFLIADDDVKEINDLEKWDVFIPNTKIKDKGKYLIHFCKEYEEKYGCRFVFCKEEEMPQMILELLLGYRPRFIEDMSDYEIEEMLEDEKKKEEDLKELVEAFYGINENMDYDGRIYYNPDDVNKIDVSYGWI